MCCCETCAPQHCTAVETPLLMEVNCRGPQFRHLRALHERSATVYCDGPARSAGVSRRRRATSFGTSPVKSTIRTRA
eukprot:9179120-Lingulodinium_polyedra.AAC.1